jgi:DHA2 family lincomycin resistance protein-like MFS transporter
VFTLGLGSVPPQLYSHASSLLGALQQVAGAAGTAISIAILSSVHDYSPTDPAAIVHGLERAFTVSAAISVLVVLFAVALPNRLPAGASGHHAESDVVVEGPGGAVEEFVSP